MEDKFKKELEQLINKYSMENDSNTPDFILAEYLSNCLRTFNTTIQRRESWYGRDKKKSDLCDQLSAEKLADTLVKLAENYRYNALCARATLYPGKTMEEVQEILKYYTAEYLLDTTDLSNDFKEQVRYNIWESIGYREDFLNDIIRKNKTGTISETEKCTSYMFLPNNTMVLNGKKYKLIPFENTDDWEITMIRINSCNCGHNGKTIPNNMIDCTIQAVRVGKQTFEVGQCVKDKGIIEKFDFENGRVIARVRYDFISPCRPDHRSMDIVYLLK